MPGIIIHSTRSIYWPVPKNACSTIKKRVCEIEGIDPGTNVHTAPFERCHQIDRPMLYKNFAIVRNPYSRLYSLWTDKIIENDIHDGVPDPNVFKNYGDSFWIGMTFKEFVHTIISIPYNEADPHFALQTKQIPMFCDIVKMEDVKPLTFALFESINVTKEQGFDYKKEYSEHGLYDVVYQHYKEDFTRFNYDKNIFAD